MSFHVPSGVPRVVAIFGLQGWRWAWARAVRELVFALDADAVGQTAVAPARAGGPHCGESGGAGLEPAAYGGAQRCGRGLGGGGAGGARAACSSTWRRCPRCASAPARALGRAGRDHGHGRRPPARGSERLAWAGLQTPQRRAVRRVLRRHPSRGAPAMRRPQPAGAWRYATLAGAGQAARAGLE